jgi:hypothetical protein
MAQRSNWIIIHKIDKSIRSKNKEVLWIEIKTVVPRNKFSTGILNVFGLIDRTKLANSPPDAFRIHGWAKCGMLHFDPAEWDLEYFEISSQFSKLQDVDRDIQNNYMDYNLVCTEPVVIALKNLIYNEFPARENMVILYHTNQDEDDLDAELHHPEIFDRFKNWWESRNDQIISNRR